MGRKKQYEYVCEHTFQLCEEDKQKLERLFGRLQIDFKLPMSIKMQMLIQKAYGTGMHA